MIRVGKTAGKAPKKSKPAARRGGSGKAVESAASPRPRGAGPQTMPVPVQRKAAPQKVRPAKSSHQAKARAKARKAKAPKVVRIPLRERLLNRLAEIDLRPHVWVSRVPFVVLVIGALGAGLALTLWLSTDAAERSYQLSKQRRTHEELVQRKEALERDVLRAESAPALADSARDLGMIPSRDIAHLVRDPQGNWLLVGTPKPADGVAPGPLNTLVADDVNEVPKAGNSVEVPVQLPPVQAPPQPAPLAVGVPVPLPGPAGVPAAPVPVAPAAPVPVAPAAPVPVAPAAPAPGTGEIVQMPPADAPQSPNGMNTPASAEQFSPVTTALDVPGGHGGE